jgi:hypothetical protein
MVTPTMGSPTSWPPTTGPITGQPVAAVTNWRVAPHLVARQPTSVSLWLRPHAG